MLQTKVWEKIRFLLLKPILKPDSACFSHTHIYICRTHPCCWKNASIPANKNHRVSGFVRPLYFSWRLQKWKATLIYSLKWNHTKVNYCTYSQMRRFKLGGHERSDPGQILTQWGTDTQRQKYIKLLFQSDYFLWGKIQELQMRSIVPVVFNRMSSLSLHLAVHPSNRRAMAAPVPKSLPQQVLLKVDASRGCSLRRNLIQTQAFSDLEACNEISFLKIFHSISEHSVTLKFL